MVNNIEQYGRSDTEWRLKKDALNADLRVAIPGIIVDFNEATVTATVRPAIREMMTNRKGNRVSVNLPDLPDVPVIMPHSGGYNISFPVQAGDECLVIFADMCIDAWWQSGGVQNQIEQRRHDLSDAFAVLGPFSQARRSYTPGGLVIENHEKGSSVKLDEAGNITLKVPQEGEVVVDGDLRLKGNLIRE